MFDRLRTRTTAVIAAALIVGSAGYAVLGTREARADQPHMRAAIALLQQARQELQQAQANKGGHRVAAIRAIDAAIAEVQEGIKFAD